MLSRDMFTLEEIALELEKLIKYTREMRSLTRYEGGEKANIQKLSLWTYIILKIK